MGATHEIFNLTNSIGKLTTIIYKHYFFIAFLAISIFINFTNWGKLVCIIIPKTYNFKRFYFLD